MRRAAHAMLAAAFVAGCGDPPASPTTPTIRAEPLVAAERELRDAVDAYEATATAGAVAPAIGSRVIAACHDWPNAARRGGYEPNNAIMAPKTLAYAGRFDAGEGGSLSVVVGTGQTGLVISQWSRARPTATSMPGHGIQTLAIAPSERRQAFRVGAARRPSLDVIEVPYRFEGSGLAGTITLTRERVARWGVHVDRGAFGAEGRWTGWWQPDLPTPPGGATTRPRD